MAEERSARKAPLTDREAQQWLNRVDRVLVGRGRSLLELAGTDASLADLKGPTGNYRAPLVVSGRTLLVGWNQAALEALVAP